MILTEIGRVGSRVATDLIQLPMAYHIVNGFFLRMLLLCYAHYQDAAFDVKYTDIDYKVFTDAARHVTHGQSPFDRHTYRYSPIIAWALTPNIYFNENFGKFLFCVSDILITLGIRSYVEANFPNKENASHIAKYSSFFWLYNPLGIVISTRGNADSLSCLAILMALYFLHFNKIKSFAKYVLSGFFLGLSIHLRIYPLIFSLPMYLSLGEYRINRNTSITTGLLSLLPNKKQLTFVFATIVSFVALTYGMYLLYGYKFIFETYIFHLFRKDTRHNFSVFFYTSYLTMITTNTFDLIKFTARVFLAGLLLLLSLAFGCDAKTLPFALFCQSAVLVIYNSVVTSQYFIWYLSLFPLVVHDIKATPTEALVLIMMWSGSQISWLFYAYLLEFQNQEVFVVVWVMGILFFWSNIVVLFQLIKLYTPGYCYGFVSTNDQSKNK